MPYWKCGKCHHEYEGMEPRDCDWCGFQKEKSIKLEEYTPLETMLKDKKQYLNVLLKFTGKLKARIHLDEEDI